jgi:hypothetical protein
MHAKAEGIADFHKFPRTHHILDAGGSGVTRDDLVRCHFFFVTQKVMDKKDVEKFVTSVTVVEEKVDGANLGISITKDYEVIFQNRYLMFHSLLTLFRSKVISSASHPQWKGLDLWVKNNPGIWDVLTSPDLILFGEWCYACHSVPYSQLPNYFIVFDLFSKIDNK